MSKKCTPLWREAHVEVKMRKTHHVRATFGRWSVVLCGRRKGLCTLPKVRQAWDIWGESAKMQFAGQAQYKRHVQRTCSDVRVLISMCGVAFWSIRSSGLLRWFCVTGALRMTWLHFFVARSTLDRWNGKISKHIVTRPSAPHSSFQFWRKSRRIASLLMFSIWKIEEVPQNCFGFDVAKFKNWGSLADLLCF